MKSISPGLSLLILVVIGIAVAGWFYGIHWKRVASGSLFSPGEKEMIRLQDQITALTEQNQRLQEKIAELSATTAEDSAGENEKDKDKEKEVTEAEVSRF